MIFRKDGNPVPFAAQQLAASEARLSREETRTLRYGLTTVARHLRLMQETVRRSGQLRRGNMASRLSVMIGDLERMHRKLMEAELAERAQAAEQAEREQQEQLSREWRENL